MMFLRFGFVSVIFVVVFFGAAISATKCSAQDEAIRKLDGTWLFVEDRTEGRPVDQGGAPMSVQFSLQVEKDAVIYPRSRGDEKITLDGSSIEKKEGDDFVYRYRGEWKSDIGSLEYTVAKVRTADDEKVLEIKRVFQPTDEGLLVSVISDTGSKQLALYQHPDEIALPEPAKATINQMAWLADTWVQTNNSSLVEEQWIVPQGGAMLGTSRTVRGEKMTGFEFLQIVEREGSLVYIAQPGGRAATEFMLTELEGQKAVFVNPRHDYPQRIIYELSAEGGLSASIGFAKGRLQRMEFTRKAE